jgi:hypothetical protein
MRETSGAELVKKLTGREVPVVLDPTLTLTAEEWERFMPKTSVVEGQYIFAYFLSDDATMREEVKKLKQKTGLKIVTMPHMLKWIKADKYFGDIELYNCTPGEWMNVIKNAAYVCTDSYHGTVFSIINKRKFLTMCAYKDGDVKSTNTRIYEVLNKFGITERLYKNGQSIEKILENINYDYVMEKLEVYREKSLEYIEHILED